MAQIAFGARGVGDGLELLLEGAFGFQVGRSETANSGVALRAAGNRNRKEKQDRQQTRGCAPSQKTVHERPMVTNAILP
jgi:hypothetical protein